MSDVETLLRQAELSAEKSSAVIRLIVFVCLALVVLSSADDKSSEYEVATMVAVYGLGASVGLVLAWLGIFGPVVAYLFCTFDVVLVAAQVLLLGRLMGMQSTFAYAVPAAALVFIILIHASMRYRPWLIAYGAILFIASIELGSPFFAAEPPQNGMGGMSMAHAGMGSFLTFQVLPITLIALGAFILVIIGHRTRNLLLTSIEQAARTARLSRYFSPNVAATLAEGDDNELLAGRRQLAAVLFVDFRGFTALGESMTPQELVMFLTEYRQRLTQPVFSGGGTVDKFIGDAIMAVFGSPIQKEDDARRALNCAREILDAATRWSMERERAGYPEVAIGIGVHYGEVFSGALGGGQLTEYTVIGDTVNVAERLERQSREVGSPLVVSAALLRAADEFNESGAWRPQALRGHQKPVEAFCLA